jgi:hypothetical protein
MFAAGRKATVRCAAFKIGDGFPHVYLFCEYTLRKYDCTVSFLYIYVYTRPFMKIFLYIDTNFHLHVKIHIYTYMISHSGLLVHNLNPFSRDFIPNNLSEVGLKLRKIFVYRAESILESKYLGQIRSEI